ncbi:MAG TPA: cytochrome c oxidase subunit 3 [Terriglobales bacterium]|nr:cytochrome c oxidase subunit 3 [Terriglobales bacterium]
MSVATVTTLQPEIGWGPSTPGRLGMYCLIAAEAAIFTIFVVAYLFYLDKSLSGPTPQQVLHVPVLFTICLLSSSLTIHFAVRALRKTRTGAFAWWWFLTLLLGSAFMAGTALEWRRLIYDEGLTIRTNLFGTTYYSLVGLHAFHVVMGLLALSIVFLFALFGKVQTEHAVRVDTLALYWHFVDTVWVVVFLVVYIIGR